jgi:hypothetical protein
VVFVAVEKRASAPLIDLRLLRNRVLVDATLAILIVAGTIDALMDVLSLYFQAPAGLGLNALEAGLATQPAAAGMIAITPAITPLAVAAVAMVNDAVINDRRDDGHSAAEALAGGLAASATLMAVWSALGVGLIVLMARQRIARPRAIDRVAAAASASHTLPSAEAPAR